MKLLPLHTQNQSAQVTSPGQISDCENCKKCTGTCTKETCRYVISTAHGMAPCRFGQMRLKANQSHIPLRFIGKSFSDYDITPDNAESVKIAKWYTAEKPAQGLYLYGECGTGKTFLASLIAQEFDSLFTDTPTLMDELKATFDGGDTEALINRYAKCKLLVLDDIGTGKVTEWNVGVLYQVINARYNANLPLIVTSNYDFDDLRNRLTVKDKNGGIIDDFTAKRIVSRLSEMCIQAFLGTNDRRK